MLQRVYPALLQALNGLQLRRMLSNRFSCLVFFFFCSSSLSLSLAYEGENMAEELTSKIFFLFFTTVSSFLLFCYVLYLFLFFKVASFTTSNSFCSNLASNASHFNGKFESFIIGSALFHRFSFLAFRLESFTT